MIMKMKNAICSETLVVRFIDFEFPSSVSRLQRFVVPYGRTLLVDLALLGASVVVRSGPSDGLQYAIHRTSCRFRTDRPRTVESTSMLFHRLCYVNVTIMLRCW